MTNVTHPNFRTKKPRVYARGIRARMISLSQETYDRIMWAIAEGKAKSMADFFERAIEEKLKREPSES